MNRLLLRLLIATATLPGSPVAQTAADSGWRPVFNGTNFNGLYAYAVGTGVVNIAADSSVVRIGSQSLNNAMFRVDSGRIRVSGSPNGYIGSIRQYSHYRVRVRYLWPANTSASANAGLLVHIDSAQVRSSGFSNTNNRPRSIEVNMRRDNNYPWSLWSAQNLGPYITTRVTSIPGNNLEGQYNPAGTPWTNDPWTTMGRVLSGSLQANPELPLGQWNQGEALLRGADSGVFTLNGQVRTRGYAFETRETAGNPTPRVRADRGNVVLQSEGAVIYYKDFEVQELDSVTGAPLHATTALKARLASSGPKAAGMRLAHTGGRAWLDLPAGASETALYDLRGNKVWTYRGKATRIALPAHLASGVFQMRTRF
jgi:hypothetical protein